MRFKSVPKLFLSGIFKKSMFLSISNEKLITKIRDRLYIFSICFFSGHAFICSSAVLFYGHL